MSGLAPSGNGQLLIESMKLLKGDICPFFSQMCNMIVNDYLKYAQSEEL